MPWHLARLNVATALYPMDDPRMEAFAARLDEVNALADESRGSVWRLQTDSGNATDIRVDADPRLLVNMSVWEDVESLFDFAYRSAAQAGPGKAQGMVRDAVGGTPGSLVGAGRPPPGGR